MQGIDLPNRTFLPCSPGPSQTSGRKEDIVQELQARSPASACPKKHPFWGVGLRVLLPHDQQRLREALPLARESLTNFVAAGADLAAAMGMSGPHSRSESEALCLAAQMAMDAPELAGVDLRSEEWRTGPEELDTLINSGLDLVSLHETYDPVLVPEAWTQDLLETRQILDAKGRMWWRLLSGEYRQAGNRLAGLCRNSLPGGVDAKVQLVDAVLKAQTLQSTLDQHSLFGQQLFGSQWQREASDWDALSTLTNWLQTYSTKSTPK